MWDLLPEPLRRFMAEHNADQPALPEMPPAPTLPPSDDSEASDLPPVGEITPLTPMQESAAEAFLSRPGGGKQLYLLYIVTQSKCSRYGRILRKLCRRYGLDEADLVAEDKAERAARAKNDDGKGGRQ